MAHDESMVAIVQGLQDAGLAVTVLNRRLLRARNPYRRPLASRSSVETNTDKSFYDYYKTNKGTNVRDGHYASSYQIAHCNARPTSPPQHSPGFPPQRSKPSRTDGNFELGVSYYVPETVTSSPRGHRVRGGCSDRYIDTGSMYTNNSERVSHDNFAHSLRRYPTFSPERSISTELVQKLLTHTQNKYLTKPTSKSQRSLTRDKSPQSLKLETKPSKNVQTYARTKREVTTRDCGANTSHDLRFMTKKGKSYSAIRESRYKDENTNSTSYDYLEQPPSSSSHSRRSNEVRYIRDVKRYIRDTIRQIYDDRPMVCPKIKSRYSHHRRLHHKGQDQVTRGGGGRNVDMQTSVPTTSKTTTFTNYCEPPPGSHYYLSKYASVSTSDVVRCCTCEQPIPCVCKIKEEKAAAEVRLQITNWVHELPIVFSENARENKKEKERIIKEIEEIISEIPKDEHYDENFKEGIASYIEKLPIWDAVESEDDNGLKNEIIDSLMDRLQSVEDKTTSAIKDVARKWLDGIEFERNIDVNKTANNFAAHLTPLLKDDGQLKSKLQDLLVNLPITNKEDVINDVHKNFANDLIKLSDRINAPVLTEEQLQNEINEFLESFPDVSDKGCNVKNLARKFKNTQSKPISEPEKEKQMKGNVVDWIDSLPKSIKDAFTPNEIEEFSNALVDKVQNATHAKVISKDRKSSFQKQQQIENDIWELLESMDQVDVDESIVKGYAFHLKEMENSDFDEEDIVNETNDFLDELDKSGVRMGSRDQDKFQKRVYNNLKKNQAKNRRSDGGWQSKHSFVASTPRKGLNVSSIGEADESSFSIADTSSIKNAEKQYNNQLNDQIESWVESLPINLDREKKQKKAIINELANDIIDRQKYLQIHPSAAKSGAEELENLKYQVFRWLNKMNNVKDHEMASVMDKTKTLMDKIKNVDVPQFGKSSLKTLTRDENVKSPTNEKSIRSPISEQSYNSSAKEQSSGSPTKVKHVGSLTREHSFGTTTYIPTQDTSMFIKENLDGAITDWVKQLPLYEKASSEQKRMFEKVVPEISKGIKKVYDGIDNSEQDVDKLVIDEIEKQMEQLPISSVDKKDKKFMTQTATQLLQYLKDQQMFQNLSERADETRDAEALADQTSDDVGPSKISSRNEKTVTINELKSVGDNLSGAITDWMKQQPAYLEKKAELDKLIPNISETVRSILKNSKGRDQDKALIDEITKQLKNTPLELEDSETAKQLVQYMKDLQMLHENPETTTQTTLEDLNDTVNSFAKNQDFKKVTWADKKKFQNLKSGLATKLKDLVDKGADRDTLKKEIKQYLSKFPLSEDELRDGSLLDKKAEELIESLPSNDNSPDVYSYVRKGFMKWMKKLPLDNGKGINDISKEAIDRITTRLSNHIIHADTITIADTKKLIEEETNRFLQEAPLDGDKLHDPKKLANDLFDCIKGSSKPTNKASSKNNTAEEFILTSSDDNTAERSIPYMDQTAKGSILTSSKDQTAKGSMPTSYMEKTAKGYMPTSFMEKTAKGYIPTTSKDQNAKGSIPTSYMEKTAKGSIPTSNMEKTAKASMPTSYMEKTAKGSIPTSSKDNTAKTSVSTSTRTLLLNISGSMHPSFKSAAEQLADNVEHWVNNLPIKEETLEDKSKASNLRRHLSGRILSKVGELNTNPDIFNDDFLYEEMFEDEVDDMIKALSDEELEKEIPAHKKPLLEIVKDARLKTQEEMAGIVYKQQLREVVSQKIPSKSLNEKENASFEVLKEDVADAFVSLHYVKDVNGNAESKIQFKNNVKGEIDEFCADYLKKHPEIDVDTDKINSDLYMALKEVPVPNDETMRHEIEIIKIKEVIHNWIDKGKFFGDQTGGDKLKTIKKISVLAKKIHDIEKLKESNPDLDSDDMLKKEIKKWLQKMPLVVEEDLDILAEQLIMKLKDTEESRKSLGSTSSGRESTIPVSSYTNGARSSTPDSNSRRKISLNTKCCGSKPVVLSKAFRRSVLTPNSRTLCNCPEYPETPASRPVSVDVPKLSEGIDETTETSTGPDFTIVSFPCAPPCAIPPSTLSPADREYLKKIRERATQPATQNSPRSSKDAEVNPIPVDYASQTEITADITTTTQEDPSHTQTSIQTPKPLETTKRAVQAAGSQVEVVPHIIVKEYYWDSINSKMNPCSIITCPPTPRPQILDPCTPRSSYPCPLQTSQHAQASPPAPEELYPDSSYFLPDFPCSSRPRRSQQSHLNVGPKPKCSIRNLDWSKEECYGDRREPSEEEIFIDNTCRRKSPSFRCKERMPLTSNGTKKVKAQLALSKLCRTPDDESLKRCPKCCGVHCPFPSYLYFNNNQ